jgi:hypothetical protein
MVQQHHGRRVLLSRPGQTSGGIWWWVYAPILTAQHIEDGIAYLLTLTQE